jgi:hypothetical protein
MNLPLMQAVVLNIIHLERSKMVYIPLIQMVREISKSDVI